MMTFIKTNLKISDEQTNIDKYKMRFISEQKFDLIKS